ncbi:hypothetical protein Efla_004892 [Eimeria flavescens]
MSSQPQQQQALDSSSSSSSSGSSSSSSRSSSRSSSKRRRSSSCFRQGYVASGSVLQQPFVGGGEAADGGDEQAADLKSVLEAPSGDIPVFVIPGNHDVGTAPTPESLADYIRLWGQDFYSFWFGGVKFVFANSSLFYDDTHAPEEAEQQIKWLEQEFREGREKGAKHIFLLQHHQLYFRAWDEPDEEAHTVEARKMRKASANKSSIFRLPLRWKQRLLPLLAEYKVSASFHGHLHANALHMDCGFPQIVCSACGFTPNDDKPGWRLVKVRESDFEHEYRTVACRTDEYPFLPPRCPEPC